MLSPRANRRKTRGGVPPYTDRLITEIVGVEYYDGYENRPYERHSCDQFFYDDKKRLTRCISTHYDLYGYSNSRLDLKFYYESDDRISISADWQGVSGKPDIIMAEIDLNGSGKAIRVAETMDEKDRDYTFYYTNGQLSRSIDWRGYTSEYAWTDGDLTAIRVTPSPYTWLTPYVETCTYGSAPNITNLDLNHLAYGTEYFSVFVNHVGSMLGLAGCFGRNAHYVTGNYLDPENDGVEIAIDWAFDRNGYPIGWRADYTDKGASEKNSGWEYTIYYEE